MVVVQQGAHDMENPSLRVLRGLRPTLMAAGEIDHPVPIQRGTRGTQDVLIVTEDDDLRPLLREALHDQGCTVDVASSAVESLALLQHNDYRVLLIEMLPGIRGHELLHTVRADLASHYPAIIVLSSRLQEAAVRSALAAGADDYLTTPFELHDLMLRVHLWLRPAIQREPAQHAGFRIHTLGRFYVESSGEERLHAGGRSRKASTLFKFLLTHHDRPMPASTVHNLLWPQVPEGVAAVDLRSLLYQLRKLLDIPARGASLIEHTGTTLCLRLRGDDWWDAGEFSTWLTQAARLQRAGAREQAIAAYTAGVACYAGDYMEEDMLDDWANSARIQFREEWQRALEALAALLGESGNQTEQERLLRQVLRADPFREQSYRALMTLLAEDGRSAEALVLYRQLRQILHAELDTGPDPQTHALALRIKQPT